jgi:predicted heme/steroid binding protein
MAAKALKVFTREDISPHNRDGDLWVIIDAKVYDLSGFKDLHPGGASVLLDDEVAGQDATEAFYGLHKHEILERPQYRRLQIGTIKDETPLIVSNTAGEISHVPYAEPTWLTDGFYSPYYTSGHRKFQKAVRKFVDEVIVPDAKARGADGKKPSQETFDRMAEVNMHAMRMGPGKHLIGLKLMNGLVAPEEVRKKYSGEFIFQYFPSLTISTS